MDTVATTAGDEGSEAATDDTGSPTTPQLLPLEPFPNYRSGAEEDRAVDLMIDLTANTNTPAAEDTEVEPATVEVAHEPRRSGRARQTPGGLGGMIRGGGLLSYGYH